MAIQSEYRPYFLPEQVQVLDALPQRVQDHYVKLYQGSHVGQAILRLFSEVIPHCPDPAVAENFFLALDSGPYNPKLLQGRLSLLKTLCQQLPGEFRARIIPFFQCATTKKVRYYAAETLFHMIDSFTSINKGIPDHFPPYDQGGEKLLHQLQVGAHSVLLCAGSEIDPAIQFWNSPASPEKIKAQALQLFSRLGLERKDDIENFLRKVLQEKRLPANSKCFLIKMFTLCTSQYVVEDLNELLDITIQLVGVLGEEWVETLAERMRGNQKITVRWLISQLNTLALVGQDSEQWSWLEEQFATLKISESRLDHFLKELETRAAVDHKVPIAHRDISKLLHRFSHDPYVQTPLQKATIDFIGNQYLAILDRCEKWQNSTLNQYIGFVRGLQLKEQLGQGDILDLLAIALLTVRLQFQTTIYPSQLLSVLAFLAYDAGGGLGQIKTGEGKSWIVALLAFVEVIRHKKVHIISTAHYLAIRDHREFIPFFKTFGIATNHICNEEKWQKAGHFQAEILYGTGSDFAFAYMAEMLHFETIFPDKHPGDKPFDCVIVDEVDNLTIDSALSGARLAYPPQVTYEWVYRPIYTFVTENQNNLFDDHLPSNLRNYLTTHVPKKCHPLLIGLSDEQLLSWVKNAIHAKEKCQFKAQYDIVENERGQRELIIVDNSNTGSYMTGMRWSHGVHEFLEVKEGLEVKRETLTPIALSPAVFYPLYRTFYGVTGTLGSVVERAELRVYDIKLFDIPSFFPPCREDWETRIFSDANEKLQAIKERIIEMRNRNRPILVLCKTIIDAEKIGDLLQRDLIPCELLTGRQKKPEAEILAVAGNKGASTIATNLAARGAHIPLSQDVSAIGGLHVLITFEPDSDRVEGQARGRAGRQGQKGSSEIFLDRETLQKEVHFKINTLTDDEIRNALVHRRKEKGLLYGMLHVCRGALEKHRFSKLKSFFQARHRFHTAVRDDRFLLTLAEGFADRRISQQREVKSHLAFQDRQLADEALSLFTRDKSEVLIDAWRGLLIKIVERIEEKVLFSWVESFYEESEKIIHEGWNRDIELVKVLLDQLFENAEPRWENLLKPNGEGIIHYVRSITGAVLKDFDTLVEPFS